MSQRHGNGMDIPFYFLFVLHRVIMSDMIICEGKDFSLLEYGAGGSRLRGGWQPWGLKGFGGQASKSLEKQGCTADPEQTAEHSAQAG